MELDLDLPDGAVDPSAVRLAVLKDLRSVWGSPLEVPLGDHVTVVVGPNRVGSSNVVWAIAAALDPARRFVPDRDLPRGRGGEPSVRLRTEDVATATVRWDAVDGHRHVEGQLRTGRVVHAPIDRTPRDVLRRLELDLDDPAVRAALAQHLRRSAAAVLPEVVEVTLDARGTVRLRDDLGSQLPVPETRVLVALGILEHLAAVGDAPAALVLESPEAFLHPAAQERLAARIVEVAEATAVPVLVTTSSPFAVPRVASVRVVALARDVHGRTTVLGDAVGDATQAKLLGGLLRDAGLAAVLDRVGQVPADARAVLIVEGGTDEAYLRLVADRLGRADVLDGVVIRPSGGAMGAALAAIVLRAEVDVPLLVVLDHDTAGRRARDTLVSRFGFDRGSQVVTYADVLDGHPPGIEAETLFDVQLLRRFVRERGGTVSHGEQRLHAVPHVDLTSSGKSAFVGWAEQHVRAEHLERWDDLLDLLEARLPSAPA